MFFANALDFIRSASFAKGRASSAGPRRGPWHGLLILAAACSLLLPIAASAAPPGAVSIIVKLKSGLTSDQEAAVVSRNGGTKSKGIPKLRLHVITVPQQAADAIRARYKNDPDVQSVE